LGRGGLTKSGEFKKIPDTSENINNPLLSDDLNFIVRNVLGACLISWAPGKLVNKNAYFKALFISKPRKRSTL
jgi:hypothetical protein